MISARDGLWIASTFKSSSTIHEEDAERLTRASIEFAKAILETSRDCPQRQTALSLLVSTFRAAELATKR